MSVYTTRNYFYLSKPLFSYSDQQTNDLLRKAKEFLQLAGQSTHCASPPTRNPATEDASVAQITPPRAPDPDRTADAVQGTGEGGSQAGSVPKKIFEKGRVSINILPSRLEFASSDSEIDVDFVEGGASTGRPVRNTSGSDARTENPRVPPVRSVVTVPSGCGKFSGQGSDKTRGSASNSGSDRKRDSERSRDREKTKTKKKKRKRPRRRSCSEEMDGPGRRRKRSKHRKHKSRSSSVEFVSELGETRVE